MEKRSGLWWCTLLAHNIANDAQRAGDRRE